MSNDANHTYLIVASTDTYTRLYQNNGTILILIETFPSDGS